MISNKKTNESLVLIIGFALILAVFLITFFRSDRANKSENTPIYLEEEAYQYRQISVQEIQKRTNAVSDKDNDFLIIDIRKKEEYQTDHIVDSVNIPLEDLAGANLEAGKYESLIIIGYGIESENIEAAKILERKGVSNAAILPGGFFVWKRDSGQTVSQGDPASFTDQAKITPISSEDLKALMDKDYRFYLLDIRSNESFSQGHIPQANNIFLDNLEKDRNKIPLTKEIVVYGSTDLQGFQAGIKLYDLNFFAVWVLDNGFLDWKEKGFEIVR